MASIVFKDEHSDSMSSTHLTLGIETSCDETAAAVYDPRGGVRSSVLFSQVAIHREFGGVLPEAASRSQLEKISPIVQGALEDAGVRLDEIATVAVTNGPGLPGSLLIGLCFAKAVAWSSERKLVGVDHLEGHIFSPFLDHDVPFPHLCLTASGGHTSLCLVRDFGVYEVIGHTLDDAAGEAFDKVAKLLGLPYPGGPEIERCAQAQNFKDFFDYPRGKHTTLDFSFSGLKTAVLYSLVNRGAYDLKARQLLDTSQGLKEEVASSLLVCVADIFARKLARALEENPDVCAVTFVGGVARNNYIRGVLDVLCQKRGLPFFTPSPQYCTDNAAMIAFVGNYKAQRGEYAPWDLDIEV